MSKNKIITLKKPREISEDPLTELLRTGTRKLIAEAVEAELQQLLSQYGALRNGQGHQSYSQIWCLRKSSQILA